MKVDLDPVLAGEGSSIHVTGELVAVFNQSSLLLDVTTLAGPKFPRASAVAVQPEERSIGLGRLPCRLPRTRKDSIYVSWGNDFRDSRYPQTGCAAGPAANLKDAVNHIHTPYYLSKWRKAHRIQPFVVYKVNE